MGANSEPAEAGAEPADAAKKEGGRRIRERRLALGLSQTQLGKRLVNSEGNDVTYAQISLWERGINLPHQRMWSQIAAALETTVDAIFGGIVADLPDETLADRLGQLEDETRALIRILNLEERVQEEMRAERSKKRRADSKRAPRPLADEVRSAAEAPLRGRQPKPKRRTGS